MPKLAQKCSKKHEKETPRFIMLCMELYKPISDSDGAPVLALPLATVVGISLVKDLYEDIKRHLSDRDENNRKTKVAMKNREG